MLIRPAGPQDAAGMADVLNAVIAIGGTTAHEVPKSEADVRADYVTGPEVLTAVVAEEAGRIIGWQAVGWWQDEPHIGTFVAPGIQAKGVGQGLFRQTCDLLRRHGTNHIIAHIRADNAPGLAYYARIGFRDIGTDPDFALSNGRKVGRVFRRYDLETEAH
jgi:L-amino acid N-acyltransferase YncA